MLTNLQQQQQKLQQEQQKLQEAAQQQFFQQQQAFNLSQQAQNFPDLRPVSQSSSTTSNERDDSYIKSEPMEGENDAEKQEDFDMERFRQQQAQQQMNFFNNFETKSESGSR